MLSFIVPPVFAELLVVVPPPPVVVVAIVVTVLLLLLPPPPHAARTSIPAPTTSATADSQMRRVPRSSGAKPCHVLSVCLPASRSLSHVTTSPGPRRLVTFTG